MAHVGCVRPSLIFDPVSLGEAIAYGDAACLLQTSRSLQAL